MVPTIWRHIKGLSERAASSRRETCNCRFSLFFACFYWSHETCQRPAPLSRRLLKTPSVQGRNSCMAQGCNRGAVTACRCQAGESACSRACCSARCACAGAGNDLCASLPPRRQGHELGRSSAPQMVLARHSRNRVLRLGMARLSA